MQSSGSQRPVMDISVRPRPAMNIPAREPVPSVQSQNSQPLEESMSLKPRPVPSDELQYEEPPRTEQKQPVKADASLSHPTQKAAVQASVPVGIIVLTVLAMLGLSAIAIAIYLQS